MAKQLIFVIPESNRSKFKEYYDIMHENCPVSCVKGKLDLNEAGVFTINDAGKLSESHTKYCKAVLAKVKAAPITESLINRSIKLLEKITKKKVSLNEDNEATKNLTVEALKAVSDSLDMLKQNLIQATNQVQQLAGQDIALQKLRGLSSIVETSITDVSEVITNITAMQTKEDVIENPIQDPELQEDEEKGFRVKMDTAVNDIDKVAKIIDKGNNVIIDDNDM